MKKRGSKIKTKSSGKNVIGKSKEKNSKVKKFPEFVSDDNLSDSDESFAGDEDDSENYASDDNQVGSGDVCNAEKQQFDSDSSVNSDEDEFTEHKKSLVKLKQSDPDFYKYLQENDKKLLAFDVERDSDEDSEDAIHEPPQLLEGDSEDSDFEPEEGRGKAFRNTITLAMVREWKKNLNDDPSLGNLMIVMKAFNAALARVKGEEPAEYRVEGSAVFNAVVELAVMNLEKAVTKYLRLPKNNKQPLKSKKWVKVRATLESYLTDLLKLMSGVTSNHIISVLLKHLHSVCYLIVCFKKLSRTCLKLMSTFWSTGEESIKVLAYLCILRIITCFSDSKNSLLNYALKLLYISYVKNTRFVSVKTLPQINFMRRSLADLFTINPVLSYQHAFLYIRQLAIHLRNAVTLRKKERFQTVYNWQYVNSLHLWVELLCSRKDPLNELTYPLVTIIFGCIKLIPTAQYVPLRFHCLNMLIKLNKHTDTYFPIYPYILETFSVVNLNMKHKKGSMKPFDFTCILRLSKGAMAESAFTDAVVENMYQILLDTSYNHRNSVTFPDLVVPVIVQIKDFVKTTKVVKYASKFKSLLVKIEENSKFITNERNKLAINLSDTNKIKAFEANINLKGTPLGKFWEHWNQAKAMNRPKKVEETEENKNVKPVEEPVYSIRKDLKRKPSSGPTVLFPSDDESDQEISTLLCGPLEDDDEEESNETTKKAKLSDEGSDTDVKEEAAEASEVDDDDDDDAGDQDDIVEELNLSKF